MRTILFILSIGLAGLAGVFAEAEARIDKLEGEVSVFPARSLVREKAVAGRELHRGDLVVTGEGAQVHLHFPNEGVMMVKEKSRFRISGKENKVLVEFDEGEFLIGVKRPLTKGEIFEVRTPSAVVGVRGTLFWGLADREQNSTFVCFESRIEIQAQGESRFLEPGEKVFIPFGEPPHKTEPGNVPVEYMDTFALEGSVQGVKEMLNKAPKKGPIWKRKQKR